MSGVDSELLKRRKVKQIAKELDRDLENMGIGIYYTETPAWDIVGIKFNVLCSFDLERFADYLTVHKILELNDVIKKIQEYNDFYAKVNLSPGVKGTISHNVEKSETVVKFHLECFGGNGYPQTDWEPVFERWGYGEDVERIKLIQIFNECDLIDEQIKVQMKMKEKYEKYKVQLADLLSKEIEKTICFYQERVERIKEAK